MTDRLRVAATFGPTLQGEGPSAGQVAAFVRLAGCNLSCSWCDESQTWDASRHNLTAITELLTAEEILDRLPGNVGQYVLTGGEPLLQQARPAFRELVQRVSIRASIHVETNGTLPATAHSAAWVAQWVISPKLPHAGPHRGHQNPALHPSWIGGQLGAHLKIVCRDSSDAVAALELADGAQWPRERVWLMPEGDSIAVLSARWPTIAEMAAKLGVNATHRLHILAGVP